MKKIILILAGCAVIVGFVFYSGSPSSDKPMPVLPETSWVISSVLPNASVAEESILALGFTILFEKGRTISGKICNSFSGKYIENGPSVRFSDVITTKMYCNPEIMKYEDIFLETLNSGIIYHKDGINLVLVGTSGSPTFFLVPQGKF